MSTQKTLNGTLHLVPETGEYSWGDAVSDYLEDVCDVVNGTFQVVTASGATTTINFANGRNVRLTLNASTTLTLTNPRGGRPMYIHVKQGGSYTLAWPSTVKWQGGTAPTITTGAGARDVIALQYDDSVYLGDYGQDYK